MKKSLAFILLVLVACLVCLSACEDPNGEISAEKWAEVLGGRIPDNNVTIKSTYVYGKGTEVTVAKLDLSRKKFFVHTEDGDYVHEEYFTVENDEFYSYVKNGDGKWEKYHESKLSDDPLGAKTLVEAIKSNVNTFWVYFPEFKDKFDLFSYDAELKQYVAQGAQLFNSFGAQKVVYKFDNEKPVYVEMQFSDNEKIVFELFDYNSTKVSLPSHSVVLVD